MPDADRSIVLDAGAFIAYERDTRRARGLFEAADRDSLPLLTSAAVVAQVWHGSARQARLARLLGSDAITEKPLDSETARAIGVRCAESGVPDVVDGHLAVLVDEVHGQVVTSDPSDLLKLGVEESRIVPI